MAIKTSEVVVGQEAPDHVQHMATDINNALARLTTGANQDVTDLQALIDALDMRIAVLEARSGQYGR